MMHRLTNALLTILLVASALLCAPPLMAQQATHRWPTKEWPISAPEQQGMSSGALARLVDFGLFNNMDSLLVARHGTIVLEATYAPFRAGLKHRINSATKSVVSTLVGIALKDGLLGSTDRPVVDFFADRTIANLDDRKKAMTIRHLLDMTSGLDWKEPFDGQLESFIAMESSRDWQQFILDRPMAAQPGTAFNYNSGNSHLLSAILTKVTGRSALDYARETLFEPLGIEDVLWRHDPQGISAGGCGLYLQPRDMAKIGTLYLRSGRWEGKQVLPASWIEGVRKANVDMRESWARDLRYGSQFWVMPGRDAYLAVGYNRQLIVVMPKLDIVAVVTGTARFPPLGGRPSSPNYGFDTLLGFLGAAVTSDSEAAPDSTATAYLAERLRLANIEQPSPVGVPSAMAKAVSSKTWRFAGNALLMRSLTFRFDDPLPSFEYELDDGLPGQPTSRLEGRFRGPIGVDGHTRVGGRMPYGPSAARSAWSADGRSLVLEVQTLGNDDIARVTHVFGDGTVQMSFEFASGFRVTMQGQAD
jgi:CubicO group peptidase (beta-lactamase class C family)